MMVVISHRMMVVISRRTLARSRAARFLARLPMGGTEESRELALEAHPEIRVEIGIHQYGTDKVDKLSVVVR
jgi:hypothetical protein